MVHRCRSGQGKAHFSVLALGKLGGRELNYSSDIDLMFLYSRMAKLLVRRLSATKNSSRR